MPIASHLGVNLYYEAVGDGPALLCLHGLWSTHQAFYQGGWVSALSADYRLIMPDMRGQGASDKPHDVEAYLAHTLAGDALAVLDAEGVALAHVLGYSMGGWIAHAVARQAPGRVRSLMIGGAGVDPHQAHGVAALRFTQRTLAPNTGPGGAGVALAQLSAGLRAQLAGQDLVALRALVTAWIEHPTDGMAHLPALQMPALVFCGDRDPYEDAARQSASAMPRARFVSLPGHTHDTALLQCPEAVEKVKAFLDEIEAQSRVAIGDS